MLNIGKLAIGGESYYLESVAKGIEDYYLGNGEAPGYWLGSGADAMGLAGQVEAAVLQRVLAGLDPGSGERLEARRGARVPGFDLTFRPPKSASILYALDDPVVSSEVVAAHDEAVAAALGYMERNASDGRRGAGGVRSIDTSGFIAAGFRHRTSRAGDPLLHTHVLVANLIQGDDGRWSRLDSLALWSQAKTTGYLYQAHFRAAMTRRLGVEWGPVTKGTAELVGIDKEVRQEFSQRRGEIVSRMAQRGETSAAAAQAATLDTRRVKDARLRVDNETLAGEWAKDYGVTPQNGPRLAGWRARAEALGLKPDTLADVRGRTDYQRPSMSELRSQLAELLGPTGLTERASTFSRRDAIQAWCNSLPQGADVADVEILVDQLLTDERTVRLDGAQFDGSPSASASLRTSDVIRLRSGPVVPSRTDVARYTTTELLAAERSIVDGALSRRYAMAGLAEGAHVDAAIASSTLGEDQEAMVRQITSSGAGIDVVVGKAGTGKTFALNVARQAWEASGASVRGAALAAKAASGLQEGAGIASTTVDRLLFDLDRATTTLDAHTVVVVDEAGMLGTRKLARLLEHAQRTGAKVVLVGDHRQLPEIDAGGAFRGLRNRLPVVELHENHRQAEAWERDALDQLRDGDVGAALSAYVEHDRLVTTNTPAQRKEQMISDWASVRSEQRSVLMLAYRRVEVRDLNRAAQQYRRDAGELGDDVARIGDEAVAVGDEVLTLKNARRLGVNNGDRAVVMTRQTVPGGLRVRYDNGRVVELPQDYLDAGHVSLGYATTVHKAQGATSDVTLTLASDQVFRELGYVAQSRGRTDNRLYLVGDLDAQVRRLEQTLRRSRSQTLAIDLRSPEVISAPERPPQEVPVSDVPEPRLREPADMAETYRNFDRLDHLVRSAPPVREAELRRAENELEATRRAVRRAPDEETLQETRRRLATLHEEVEAERAAHEARVRWDAAHGDDVVAYREVTRQITDWERQRVQQLRHNPPAYVRAAHGPRPADHAGRERWDTAVMASERELSRSDFSTAEAVGHEPPHAYDTPDTLTPSVPEDNDLAEARSRRRGDLQDPALGIEHGKDVGYSR